METIADDHTLVSSTSTPAAESLPPKSENLQEIRFENLKSLLVKSSRFSTLLLSKIQAPANQADENTPKTSESKRGRKRKTNSSASVKKKQALNEIFDSDQRSTEHTDDDNHEHLLEYDTPKTFTGECNVKLARSA